MVRRTHIRSICTHNDLNKNVLSLFYSIYSAIYHILSFFPMDYVRGRRVVTPRNDHRVSQYINYKNIFFFNLHTILLQNQITQTFGMVHSDEKNLGIDLGYYRYCIISSEYQETSRKGEKLHLCHKTSQIKA